MSEIDGYRKKIDQIDKLLTELFEERMNTVLKVSNYKKKNDLPVLNRDRETEVIEKNIKNLKDPNYQWALKKFYTNLINLGKELEYKMIRDGVFPGEQMNHFLKVGCYGVQGSFSEEAMFKFFGKDVESSNYEEFEDVFLAVKNDEIDFGVVPIENSSTGAISQVYDLLTKYEFYIVGEQYIKVNQHLIGLKGTDLSKVQEVYSHPQGFEQTSKFLKNYKHWRLIPFLSTADSVRHIRELNDQTKVAIAGKRAAEIYNLEILKENINNKVGNSTRFIIISKHLQVAAKSNKTSVVFSLEHKVGTLYQLLSHFAENDINMMKIESRPTEEGNWKYVLYVDFEGNIRSEKVKKALSLIEEGCEYFRLLGCYQQDSVR
ncbi:prephenate dehydratase [Caldifermentibacillus hisashii]|uniref:prephenate dehydratase n=1 Tax=Caldifermentibacillus hisashii TaxID=996558 RepID=UPI00310191E8